MGVGEKEREKERESTCRVREKPQATGGAGESTGLKARAHGCR